jgi:hypothetical protein
LAFCSSPPWLLAASIFGKPTRPARLRPAEAFKKYLVNQQAMQKMGMQMAQKMFAPAKSGGN